MDCDGPKHALVRDVDGSLLGSSPVESSIIPFAELRYSVSVHCFIFPYHIPLTYVDLMKVVLQRHGLLMLVHWIDIHHQM